MIVIVNRIGNKWLSPKQLLDVLLSLVAGFDSFMCSMFPCGCAHLNGCAGTEHFFLHT